MTALRASVRLSAALSFVAFVSYGGCSEEGAAPSEDKSLRTGTTSAVDLDSDGVAFKDDKQPNRGNGVDKNDDGEKDHGQGKGLETTATKVEPTPAYVVDGLVQLDDATAAPEGTTAMTVDGLAETVRPGDWVVATEAVMTVQPEPVIPAPYAEPTRLAVAPETTVAVDDGVASVVTETVPTTEVVVVMVNDANDVIETTVPCNGECAVDVAAVAAEQEAEAVAVETADPASAVLVPEAPAAVDEQLDAVVVKAAPDRSGELQALRARRRELRGEIKAKKDELALVKDALDAEQARVEAEVALLREKRESLLDERAALAASLGSADQNAKAGIRTERDKASDQIDEIQTEIAGLKSGLDKLRDEWASLAPERDQLAVMRAELKRLKGEILALAALKDVYCASRSGFVQCKVPAGAKTVELLEQVSKAACVAETTFGVKDGALWVDAGCRGRFLAKTEN